VSSYSSTAVNCSDILIWYAEDIGSEINEDRTDCSVNNGIDADIVGNGDKSK